jgi:carboxylesterase type B
MMIFPKIFWWYCILIFQVMCRDPPTVKIKDQGTVSGMFMKMYRTQSIVAYLGLPYAHPPLGILRFTAPVVDNLPSWEGTRNGSVSQPNCYQNANNPPQKHTMVLNKLLTKVMDMNMTMMEMGSDRFDEDCLYLNIFVPDGEQRKLLSVFHLKLKSISSFFTQKCIFVPSQMSGS